MKSEANHALSDIPPVHGQFDASRLKPERGAFPLAHMSDIDETAYCSNGLEGHDINELHKDSRVLKARLEIMRDALGTKIIHNTGKEYPYGGYKIKDGSFYDPILATPDAIISGGGANIHTFDKSGEAVLFTPWRDRLVAKVGTEDLWPMVEEMVGRVPSIKMLGREWSKEQFIDDPLRVPCVWDNKDEPFDVLKVDALVKKELGPHLSAFLYPVVDGGFGITPTEMNKATAGRFLLKHYGISPEDTTFGGDSMNDVHAARDTGFNRIIVGNAHAELVRAVTDGSYVCPHNGNGKLHICQPEMVAARGVMHALDTMYPRMPAIVAGVKHAHDRRGNDANGPSGWTP